MNNEIEHNNELRQIALYESPDHTVHLDVKVDEETVWLTQQQMAALFGRDVTTIRRHIKSARNEELQGIPTSANFALVQSEGGRTVERQVEHYNLDMILSVGYRVKSKEGIYFRRWANSVLKQHLVAGYTINRKRLESLRTVVKVLSRSDEPEIAGTAKILERYLPSLELLNDYDTGNVPTPKGQEPHWRLTYDDASEFVRSLPFYGRSDLFGRERNGAFEGIVNGLYQTFAGQELYRSVQEKAANLLYQIVKDHPFSDGNKRCAAALFVYFLDGNGALRDDETFLVEGNALAAMTLMIALSDPGEKDTMIALVENFLAHR
ncbi:RhuM family protein [Bifidobacterium vespertilionis]|uniref:RhuM family protein n=1 Tax=Bifidobacterium vespertilionis TaxID=2562524 RepID=UPI001BDC1D9A|nr:RhuM family protein [Bifidobacterium vespertilionis]MBT1179205.1 virulence protein RhuM/Fic/DOC family protein [Bifidobacterium vespertilionis]